MLELTESFVSHELITISEGPTWIYHSKNSETAKHRCSLKHNHSLKSQPNIKLHINYRLLFCQYNWSLKYHSTFLMKDTNKISKDKYEVKQLLKINMVNMYFRIFQPKNLPNLCLNFCNPFVTPCTKGLNKSRIILYL